MIASIGSILGTLNLLVLSVNSVIVLQRGLASATGELPVWGTLAGITGGIALVLLSKVQRDPASRR